MNTVPILAVIVKPEQNGTIGALLAPLLKPVGVKRKTAKMLDFRPGLRVKVITAPHQEHDALAHWRDNGGVTIERL